MSKPLRGTVEFPDGWEIDDYGEQLKLVSDEGDIRENDLYDRENRHLIHVSVGNEWMLVPFSALKRFVLEYESKHGVL